MALARAIEDFKKVNSPQFFHIIKLTIELVKEGKDSENNEQARELIKTTLKNYAEGLAWDDFFNHINKIISKNPIKTEQGNITISEQYRVQVVNEIQNAIYANHSQEIEESILKNKGSANTLKSVLGILNNPPKELFMFVLEQKLFHQIDDAQKVKWIQKLDLSGNDLADLLDLYPDYTKELMDLFDKANVGNKIFEATEPFHDGSNAYLLNKLRSEREIKVSDEQLSHLLSNMSRDDEANLFSIIADRANKLDERLLLIALSNPLLFNLNREYKRYTKRTPQDTQISLQNLVNLASDQVISQAAGNLWNSQSNEKNSKLAALYKAKIKKDIIEGKDPADSIPDDIQGKAWFAEQYLNNVFTELNDASLEHQAKLNKALFDPLSNFNDEKNYFNLLSPESRQKLLHLFARTNPKELSELISKLVSTVPTPLTINTYSSLISTIISDDRNLTYIDSEDIKKLINKIYSITMDSRYGDQRQKIASEFKQHGLQLGENEHFRLEVKLLGKQFDRLYESDKKEDLKLKEKFITNFLNDISNREKDERNSAYISMGKDPMYRARIAKLALTVNPGILHSPGDGIKTYRDELHRQVSTLDSLEPSQIKTLHTFLNSDELIKLSIEFIKKQKEVKEDKLNLDLTTRSLLISVFQRPGRLNFPERELDTIASYAFEQHSSLDFALSNPSFIRQVSMEKIHALITNAGKNGWHQLSPVEFNSIIDKLSLANDPVANLRLSSFIASYLENVPDEILRGEDNRKAMSKLCQIYFDQHHDNDDKMNAILQYFMDPHSSNIKKEIISESLLNTKKAVGNLLDKSDNVDIFKIIIGHLRNIVVRFVFNSRFNSPDTTLEEILNEHMNKVKPLIQKEMRKILFEQNDVVTGKLIKEFATRDINLYKASITSAVYDVVIPLIQPYVSKQIWEERIKQTGIRGVFWRVAAYLSGKLKKANEAIQKQRELYEDEKQQIRSSSPQGDHKGQPDAVLRSKTIVIKEQPQPKSEEKLSPSPVIEDYFGDHAAGKELKEKIGLATEELKKKELKGDPKLSSSPTRQFSSNNLPSEPSPTSIPPKESKRNPKQRGKH